MIDNEVAQLALRNRARSLTVCTTGATSLSATATGYARSAGSFVTEGFRVGMEVVASGFSTAANNGNGVVTFVSALVLTVSPFVVTVTGGVQTVTRPATVVEAEAAGRTIAARLPSMRAWENIDFTPAATIPYVEEDFAPETTSLLSFPAQGGTVDETGLYVLRWYGLSGSGIGALRKSVDALKLLFAPGTTLTAGSDTVRVRGGPTEPGPSTSQILPQSGGWSVIALSIPWRAFSTNAVAA